MRFLHIAALVGIAIILFQDIQGGVGIMGMVIPISVGILLLERI